ncbi:MAG: STAS domain-containing protein [Solirubrobacterales bacterium]|nr:STAS domain-containing protein [Solirubrobacterales bacterium]
MSEGHTPPTGAYAAGCEPFVMHELAPAAGTLHLLLHGELDLVSAPEVERRIVELAADRDALVVDLRALCFLDSSGLRALISASREAARQGCTVELTRGRPEVMRIFDLAGLTERLPFLAR